MIAVQQDIRNDDDSDERGKVTRCQTLAGLAATMKPETREGEGQGGGKGSGVNRIIKRDSDLYV